MAGGQKLLNKFPQAWKNLPGSKLADGEGLKWIKSNNHHLRIMDANPSSPNPFQQVPYSKFFKDGHFIDINGNPLTNGDLPGAHIPISDLTDAFFDNFFN